MCDYGRVLSSELFIECLRENTRNPKDPRAKLSFLSYHVIVKLNQSLTDVFRCCQNASKSPLSWKRRGTEVAERSELRFFVICQIWLRNYGLFLLGPSLWVEYTGVQQIDIFVQPFSTVMSDRPSNMNDRKKQGPEMPRISGHKVIK